MTTEIQAALIENDTETNSENALTFSSLFSRQLAEYLRINNFTIVDKRDAERLNAIKNIFRVGAHS